MDPFSAIEAGSVSLLRACDLFRSDVLGCVGFVKPKIFSTKIFLAPIFPSLVCGPLTRSPILLDLGWPSAAGLRPRLEISCSGICSCRNALPAVFPAGLLHPGALHSSGPHATGVRLRHNVRRSALVKNAPPTLSTQSEVVLQHFSVSFGSRCSS
jgi:hypothetical protein